MAEKYYDINIQLLSTEHLDTVERLQLIGSYLGLPEDSTVAEVLDTAAAWAMVEIIEKINRETLQQAIDQTYLEIERFKMRMEENGETNE